MSYLIYNNKTGKIDALRDMPVSSIETVLIDSYGKAPAILSALEFYGDYPMGKKIDIKTLKLIDDADLIPAIVTSA